ncbi:MULTISPECIES: HNH endonuclease [Bacillus]|uniref:HNH endonuclease n=1 Tax=Bacillus TaxID=1386 RepID=UPI00068C0651|nr:HNH endonuclease [Bacillus sp. UNC322MFChir4.1]
MLVKKNSANALKYSFHFQHALESINLNKKLAFFIPVFLIKIGICPQILNNINFIGNTIDIIVCPFDILGFPIFKGYDVKLTMRLDKSLYIKLDDMQFKACTQMLKEAIENGEIPKEIFTPKQLKEIKIGLLRIIKLLLREQGLVSRGSLNHGQEMI